MIGGCVSSKALLRLEIYEPDDGSPGLLVKKAGIEADSFRIRIERPSNLEESRPDTILLTREVAVSTLPCSFVTLPMMVYFDRGSDCLYEEQVVWLTALADALRYNPDAKVVLIGHTDSIGSRWLNEELAWNRARFVSYCLERHGVSANRIEVYGAGEYYPTYDNRYRAGQNGNRRVDILVTAPANTVNSLEQIERICYYSR